jgi:hypothetical protein
MADIRLPARKRRSGNWFFLLFKLHLLVWLRLSRQFFIWNVLNSLLLSPCMFFKFFVFLEVAFL